jgi:hypothetical protein
LWPIRIVIQDHTTAKGDKDTSDACKEASGRAPTISSFRDRSHHSI